MMDVLFGVTLGYRAFLSWYPNDVIMNDDVMSWSMTSFPCWQPSISWCQMAPGNTVVFSQQTRRKSNHISLGMKWALQLIGINDLLDNVSRITVITIFIPKIASLIHFSAFYRVDLKMHKIRKFYRAEYRWIACNASPWKPTLLWSDPDIIISSKYKYSLFDWWLGRMAAS